jgi:hypothetical protein
MPSRGLIKIRKISRAPYRGMVVVDSFIDHFLQNDGNPEDLFLHNAHFIKSSRYSRAAMVEIDRPDPPFGAETFFAKEFCYKNYLHSFKPIFSRHRAQIMWRNSLHLLNCGINVPEPLGYLLKFKGLSCRGGYFFSKFLLGCDNLGTLALNSTKISQRLEFGGLIEALAVGVADLHNRKVIHRDLKWSNIMVLNRKNKFWFIDLESAKLCWFPPGLANLARDIARFVLNCQEVDINESIIERFLDTYARYRKITRESLDKPVTRVLKKLKEKHRKRYGR